MVLLVRNCQLMASAPLATSVTSTKPSGIRTITNASHMSTVMIWFLDRRQPDGSRRSTGWASESETAAIIPPWPAAWNAPRTSGPPG